MQRPSTCPDFSSCDYHLKALGEAAECGHVKTVRKLLRQNGNVNLDYAYKDGQTLLVWTATKMIPPFIYQKGTLSVIELLLEHGANPNSKDSTGRAALSYAAERGHQDLAELLLRQKDIDRDSQDVDGRTPLSWAVEYKEFKGQAPSRSVRRGSVVETLLWAEADPNVKDRKGRTPLSYAAERGQYKIMAQLLSKNVKVDSPDFQGRTPLWWAASAGKAVAITSLLTSKADPEIRDNNGLTPLSCAAEYKQEAAMKALVAKDGIALHVLAEQGQLEPLKSLLRNEYDVNRRNIRGQTPLHIAALSGNVEIAKELIHWRANVHRKDANDRTPLNVAVQYKKRDVIDVLLKSSALATNIMSWELVDAYEKASDVVIELLRAPCGDTPVRFHPPERISIEPGLVRRVVIFADHSMWSQCVASHPEVSTEKKKLPIYEDVQSGDQHDRFIVVGRFPPTTDDSRNLMQCAMSTWSQRRIAWTMVPPSGPTEGSGWKSIDHFSTLPYGWVPTDGADFFVLFIRKLKEDWLELCRSAEIGLSQRRTEQLGAQGNNIGLINRIAEDAQGLAKLRSILREQGKEASRITKEYCRAYDQFEGGKTMQAAITEFTADVNESMSRLEQTVKELLQVEFAWVSINEAHRSTSIATSMKRLSWITFIILPAMFASSLFGMNVNILESNPDWRWYLLFGGGCLALTVLVWLLLKSGHIEQWVENLGRRFQQWANNRRRAKVDTQTPLV